MCVHVVDSVMPSCRFSHAQLFATLWTVARQTPLSMGLSANFSLETRTARRWWGNTESAENKNCQPRILHLA